MARVYIACHSRFNSASTLSSRRTKHVPAKVAHRVKLQCGLDAVVEENPRAGVVPDHLLHASIRPRRCRRGELGNRRARGRA